MYFENFSDMYYSYLTPDGETEYVLVKDITQNIRFKKEVLENVTLYEYYDIRDGDTPEIISEKFYGTPLYHWMIMLANQKYDYIEDYPLATRDLESVIDQKYGDTKYDVHHYEKNGFVVDNINYPDATPVSNYQNEFNENEKKRRIKIISPSLLNEIVKQFRDIV